MFDKILLAIDGSEHSMKALPVIGDLAAKLGSQVSVLHVREREASKVGAFDRETAEEGSTLRAGPLSVDLAAHRASLHGRDVLLSARELTLLASLLRHQGEILSRRKLLQLVWKVDFDPGSNVVEVYVAALRRKIGADFIETVRGLGYRFVVPDDTLAEDQTAAR